MAKPTAKQMIIIERLIMSMRKASERNKTKLLREEFVKIKQNVQTHSSARRKVFIHRCIDEGNEFNEVKNKNRCCFEIQSGAIQPQRQVNNIRLRID